MLELQIKSFENEHAELKTLNTTLKFLNKQPMSARNKVIFRIQNRYLS